MREPAFAESTDAVPRFAEKKDRRRVGALLNSYYHIERGEENCDESGAAPVSSDLDRHGFDAKRYFDGMVASGQREDLLKRMSDLEKDVVGLDTDMQVLVYENYNKFIRATDVIKQMKFTIDGLSPDLKCLEGNISRLTLHQQGVESGVSGRARQIEALLRQQRTCRKLQVLFGLPATLQRCLDGGSYGKAVEAYCCCAGFLRQYREMPTFQKVLEEVELQMGRIRSALESRLRCSELSVEEAVNSSVTLLDLGEDPAKVAAEYLGGRAAGLQSCLERCFSGAMVETAAECKEGPGEAEAPLGTGTSEGGPDLQAAAAQAAELYVPQLCDVVEGFQKLQEGRTGGSLDTHLISDFVELRVGELCGRMSTLVDLRCPPLRILVSCIHFVRDSLRRLHTLLPILLTRLFMAFLSSTAKKAMQAVFSRAAVQLLSGLCQLHGECKRLQESKNSGLDDVLEEIARTEQALIMQGFTALTECQPLLSLLGSDRQACQQLTAGIQEQLTALFLAFVAACQTYIGHEALTDSGEGGVPTEIPPTALEELHLIGSLEWSGLFGLALVRIGRHLEVKAVNKVWAVAKELFLGDEPAADLVPPSSLLKATRAAAQGTLTHYAQVSGQRLAHFFRNSVQSRNWMTVRKPQEPRLVVEMVLKEVHAFDAQLARILGDQRKIKDLGHQRRTLSQLKNSMELEMERLWAKKLQVFAPIPFNRNGAMVGILRIAFKALFEYMREETFAKFGLQQIQLDCAFLAEVVRDFVETDDASVLDSLLDEVVTSAQQRCIDPVLMDTTTVEVLCDEKKRKTGLKLE